MLVSTLPTAVEGILLEDLVLQAESNLLAPAIGLFITGIFLLVIDFFPAGKKIPKDVGYGTAFSLVFFRELPYFQEFPGLVLLWPSV